MQPDSFERLAAAFVRGRLAGTVLAQREPELFGLPLAMLDQATLGRLIELGLDAGLRLYRFKRGLR